MAAARRRRGLTKARTRRPPFALRVLRGLVALALAGLVCMVAYAGLRYAGVGFRWEFEAPPPRPPPELEGRLPPPPAPQAVGPEEIPARATEEPPARGEGDPSPSDDTRVGVGSYERIEFETYGDGGSVHSNTAVAGEWLDQGLVLSFESYTAEATQPHVLDARGYFPPDASTHALGPALTGELGLEVGVTHLDFPGRPRKVAFTLFGPDMIADFEVIVRSRGERLPASARAHSPDMRYAAGGEAGAGKATYRPGGRTLFRAERVIVESPLGIDRISLDGWGPPGHVLLLDHLEIDP